MRIMQISDFFNVVPVRNDGKSLTENEVNEILASLSAAKLELMRYLFALSCTEPSACYVMFPFGDIMIGLLDPEDGLEEEFIHLPFGYFSVNMWNKLKADESNPLFMVLRYFSGYVDVLEWYLMTDGVSIDCSTPITEAVVNEHSIVDIYSLRSYTNIYRDLERYLG